MKITVLGTDGAEVTSILIEDPNGLRTSDIRKIRFGQIFTRATTQTIWPAVEFEVETEQRPAGIRGRVRA